MGGPWCRSYTVRGNYASIDFKFHCAKRLTIEFCFTQKRYFSKELKRRATDGPRGILRVKNHYAI